MLLSLKHYIQPLRWLPVSLLLGISSPAMAGYVAVQLGAGNSAYFYDRLAGDGFSMDVDVTVWCSFRNIKTSVYFYTISEESLGHPFNLRSNTDYAAIRRDGDLLLRTRKFSFSCNDKQRISVGLSAPLEPALYYVSACLPTLRDKEGKVFPTTSSGNNFSCSKPLTVNVRARPEPDLTVLGRPQVRPSKSEYQTSETVSMSVIVRNIGNGASSPTRVRLRKSAFPIADSSNRIDVASMEVAALNPGERTTKRFQISTQNQARTTYYTGCVDGAGWIVSTSVGTYTGGEQRRDNNCSSALEIKTTNSTPSSLPSVYIERLQMERDALSPSTPVTLIADIRNGESVQFKGGNVVYRKKLPLFRRLRTNAEENTTPTPQRFTKGEVVYKGGMLLETGATPGYRVELETPSTSGRYRYTVCLSHGRKIFGCGNTVEIVVR
ncbi:MAG: hypothetical protein GXP09_12240 [Gammaproteobacteria bacterium]|nr:hypothetical protein [Gammaproteobacteria bacterium]